MEANTFIQPVQYVPFEKRTPDYQYEELIRRIMKEGDMENTIQGERAKSVKGHMMTFDLSNGFPITTLRDFEKGFKGSLGEHIGFLNGAQTIDELSKYGCPKVFWERWVTAEKCAVFGLPPGDLGPASYGAAWTRFPTDTGKFFNQIENIQRQVKHAPDIRTHRIDPWIPYLTASGHSEFKRKVVVAPCHGWIRIYTNSETKIMDIYHQQRSADVLVGLAGNITQYAAFGMMLAAVTGYTFRKLIYSLEDAHIYESQFEYVDKLLSIETQPFPTVELSGKKERIEDYRISDFKLTDYHPGPGVKIPTPV